MSFLFSRSAPISVSNIFVLPEDNNHIVAFIDWQSKSISQVFIDALTFLKASGIYLEDAKVPNLPESFGKLDTDIQENAVSETQRATCSKAYEVAHVSITEKLILPNGPRRIIARAPSEDGITHLYVCLYVCLIRIGE